MVEIKQLSSEEWSETRKQAEEEKKAALGEHEVQPVIKERVTKEIREEILKLIVDGKTNEDIAKELSIRTKAVRRVRRSQHEKEQVNN